MLSLFCGGKNDADVHDKEAYEKAAKRRRTNAQHKESQNYFFQRETNERERKRERKKNKKKF